MYLFSLSFSQADGLAKISPIVALYAGHPQLETVVREVVKVTQDNELALATAVAGKLPYIITRP